MQIGGHFHHKKCFNLIASNSFKLFSMFKKLIHYVFQYTTDQLFLEPKVEGSNPV